MDSIFESALDLPADERNDFLNAACGTDLEMRQQIERLIVLDTEAEDFMSQPLTPPPGVRTLPGLEDLKGQRFGPYLLLRRLGHGGMGSIYLAERQDEYHQQVAIKVMHRGFDNDEMELRFRSERQALARLEHPNIARLYDGGTSDDGHPFLVMELIDGSPIDRYCDRRRLSIRRRLRLFQQLCSGVDHAHRNLLVHRDIKPTNILVTHRGTPKLLDFGIAKLLGPIEDGDEASESDMRPMTPGYASPEQVLGKPVATASDVYSLGVLLYELLSGRRPYRMTLEVPWIEVQRNVCFDPPNPPSQRVLEDAEIRGRILSAEDLARQRETSPLDLQRQLRGDLDQIVLKALSKDPEQRYSSAEELGRDIQRFFDGRPVLAMQGNWTYQAGKFVARHSLWVILLGLLVLVLGVSFFAMGQEARLAKLECQRAEAVSAFLLDTFEAPRSASGKAQTLPAEQLIELSEGHLNPANDATGETTEETLIRASKMLAAGSLYLAWGNEPQAEVLFRRALDLTLDAPNTSQSQLTMRSQVMLAESVARQGRYEEASQLNAQAQQRVDDSRLGELDNESLARLFSGQAALQQRAGNLAAYEDLLRQSLAHWRQVEPPASRSVGRVLQDLARLETSNGDLRAASDLLQEAWGLQTRAFGGSHPETLHSLELLVETFVKLGRAEEAQTWQQRLDAAQDTSQATVPTVPFPQESPLPTVASPRPE